MGGWQTGRWAIVAVLAGVGSVAGDNSTPSERRKEAETHFAEGRFEDAYRAYQELFEKEPTSAEAALRLGEIALLGNRLKDAERHLQKALELTPANDKAKAFLAETYYRRDDFARAAALLREIGKTIEADKLASLQGQPLYHVDGSAASTSVKFIQTDPLPLLAARVNDKEDANFILDTGGGELILDPDFVDRLGSPRFGSEVVGPFAGDTRASVEHGRIDSIQLGDFTIRNLPVAILSTKKFNAAAGGRPVHGIVGTVLLYHFLSTIDYPKGELRLERRTNQPLTVSPEDEKAGLTHSLPFWMAGDHLMLAWGRVNQGEPMLMLVDTGLAGGGFTCPQSTVKAAGIDLTNAPMFQGVGGGGPVEVRPFLVQELSLGPAVQKRINAFAGPFPESLENRYGFRIGGLISHAFLRHYAVTFDFERMRIHLTTGK